MGILDSAVGISQECLREGFFTISREIQVSGEHLRSIFRQELQRQLQPLVEEAMTRSEMRRAATPRQLCLDVGAATTSVTTVRVIRGRDVPGLLLSRIDRTDIVHFFGWVAVGYVGTMAAAMK